MLQERTPVHASCPNCGQATEIGVDAPILQGDRLLVDKMSQPGRWDVFVFRFPKDRRINYVKRLVGLPGETPAPQLSANPAESLSSSTGIRAGLDLFKKLLGAVAGVAADAGINYLLHRLGDDFRFDTNDLTCDLDRSVGRRILQRRIT